MTKESPVVIEFGDERGRNVYFPPLDRRIRGRFDAAQLAKFDRDAGSLVSEWPEPVAGQRLAIDDNEVALVEPLHEFPAIAARLKQRNLRLAPPKQTVNCDTPTALYYAREAVKAGQARLISGSFPDIDETKVRRDFIIKPTVSPQAKIVEALNAQATAFNRLADVLEKALTKR